MTNQTAKNLFNALYDSLDRNSFRDDVGTFLITSQRRNELYLDSEIGFKELFNRAQNPLEAKHTLRILVDAIDEYFFRASNIPVKYFLELDKLPITGENIASTLKLSDEMIAYPTDLQEILNPMELTQLFAVTRIIKQGLIDDLDDETILNELSEI